MRYIEIKTANDNAYQLIMAGWQERDLDSEYGISIFECFDYFVKENMKILTKIHLCCLGIKYWLSTSVFFGIAFILFDLKLSDQYAIPMLVHVCVCIKCINVFIATYIFLNIYILVMYVLKILLFTYSLSLILT